MKQTLNLITLCVNDLEKSKEFYSNILGWKEVGRDNDIAFYQTNNLGVIISLYPKKLATKDLGVKNNEHGFPNFTLALNVDSEKEVDEIISDLCTKGVEIFKEPEKVFWGGYSAYFKDLDGFLWGVAYNPFWVKDENGNIDLNDKSKL